jgi:hypothetical protein
MNRGIGANLPLGQWRTGLRGAGGAGSGAGVFASRRASTHVDSAPGPGYASCRRVGAAQPLQPRLSLGTEMEALGPSQRAGVLII